MVPGTPTQAQPSSLLRIAFAVGLIYIFLVCSRIPEFTFYTLHLQGIAGAAGFLLAIFSGGLGRALWHRIGICLAGFLFWMALSTPFSVWPGGSAHTLLNVIKTIPVYFVLAGMALTFQQWRRAIWVIALGILGLSILTLFFGELEEGRLKLLWGTYGNPNDLAQGLFLALPFWWLGFSTSGRNWVRRIAIAGVVLFIAATIARTGSRGVLVSMAACGILYFWRAPLAGKVRFLLLVVALGVGSVMVLPGYLKTRFFTLTAVDETKVDTQQEYDRLGSAVGSTEQRLYLLKTSVLLTLEHPLLGVGPGQFQVAENTLARERGETPAWRETHNMYTQLSSELGIPGLVFYLGMMVFSFRICRKLHRQCHREPRLQHVANSALALELSLAGIAAGGLFGSVAYGFLVPMLAALALALERTGWPEAHAVLAAGAPRQPIQPARRAPRFANIR